MNEDIERLRNLPPGEYALRVIRRAERKLYKRWWESATETDFDAWQAVRDLLLEISTKTPTPPRATVTREK